MNVNQYMDRDFELLQKRLDDVRKAYYQQDRLRTMSQATEMFEAFQRQFESEDFLLSKVRQTSAMQPLIEKLLIYRRQISETLEEMLMLHVSEPDFMKALNRLCSQAKDQFQFLANEYYPEYINHISEHDRKYMSHALEDRFHRFAL